MCRYAKGGLVLGRRGNAGRDPGFVNGDFTIQDEASQLIVELLDPQPGEHVLDTCAAPGTKATAIAERVGSSGSVLALDRHGRRLDLLARDARRLSLAWITTVERDSSASLLDLLPEAHAGFDRVLVDAPCSGLGALRRNPDARWRVRPEDIDSVATTQRAILESALGVLRVGGRLVYSTCTIEPTENERVVELVLARVPNIRRVPREALPSHLQALLDERGDLRTWPHRMDTDGFYAASLERTQ
jgi:16S rRNA (cytosine967-C5)-methyltransferase